MPREAVEEEREDGQRDELGGDEEGERRDRLREPDRAAVARREHEAVEHALLALGHERPAEPEQRGEDDRDPEEAARREPRRVPGSEKWKTTNVATTKSSIAGSVSRARSSSSRSLRASARTSAKYFMREREPRRRERLDARRIVGRDEHVRSPRSSASCASSSSAPAASSARVRLVEHEQLRLVQQHATEREPLGHAARVRDDAVVARLPEAEALEQHADPLAPFGHAIEAPVQVEVLERRQLAVDERLVRRGSRSAPRVTSTVERRPRSACARPAQMRSSVVLPEPFGPVTTAKPPRGQRRGRRRAGRACRRSACRGGWP